MTLTAPVTRPKVCPQCGRSFGCAQGEPGCWCEAVTLARDTLAELRTLADDCLCPACLGGFAKRDAAADGRVAGWAKATPHSAVRARGTPTVWAAGAVFFVLISFLVGLGVGAIEIGPGAIVESLLAHLPLLHVRSHLDPIERAILWQLRAPRVVLAALVGGMLAVAGSAYQGVFRNPLADPYLLGIAAGAGLGATVAIAYASAANGSGELLPLAAFGGAIVGVTGAYVLGRSVGGARSTGTLILAGVTVAAFMTAAQTFVQQQRSQTLREVYAWLLGGFGAATWHEVVLVAPYIVLSSAVILLHRRLLDVLSLGDEEAASLGVNVRRVRLVIVIAATLGTAAAVAVSGLIGFVGIIVPHTIRLLVSTSYRAVVPLSLLVGAGFLVLADVIARTALAPEELPIGVVTAFFGAPFFALVLRTTRGDEPLSAVETRELSVRLSGNEVVRSVSATVARGEWLALIGPNGAGKTTLLRALAGLVSFTGQVLLDGRALGSSSRREAARQVALVPQKPQVPPELTVAEYVLLGRTPHIGYLATETRSDRLAAERAIVRLGLRSFTERQLGSLSGGELQRTVLARALAQEAPLLLLDEPTSALDLGRQQQAFELVDTLRLQEELTVICAMHDLSLASQYADRLLLLDRGQVVGDGPADEVISEEGIASLYGASVRVMRENGSVFVLPDRKAHA